MTTPDTNSRTDAARPPQEDLTFLRRWIWLMAAKMILVVGVTVGVLWYNGLF